MLNVDEYLARIKERDRVACPHCGSEVDMTDGERLQGHVTYWGDDAPAAISCDNCDAEFYLKEHVTRYWTVGRTPDEADEL